MKHLVSKTILMRVISLVLLSFIMTIGVQGGIVAAPQDDTSPPDMPMKPAEPHPHR